MKKWIFVICTLAMVLNINYMAFAAGAETKITNTNEMSVIDISLSCESSEDKTILPGEDVSMVPSITNNGAGCYIRSRLAAVVKKDGIITDLPAPFGIDSIINLSKDWKQIGDYLYYTKPLEHGETIDMFEGFHVYDEMGNEYAETNIDVNMIVEAVQKNFFTPDFDHMSPWGNIETSECIREGYDFMSLRLSKDGMISIHYDGAANQFVTVPDDFFGQFAAMEPGGVYTGKVNVKNDGEYEAELFFRTDVTEEKDLLEELQLDITQVFANKTEKLLYKGPLNSHDLQNYISLGVYNQGEFCDLRYTITVPEYLDNEYTLEKGSIDWYFMADLHLPDETEDPMQTPDDWPSDWDDFNPEYPDIEDGTYGGSTQAGKTGDMSDVALYMTLAGVSLVTLIYILREKAKKA